MLETPKLTLVPNQECALWPNCGCAETLAHFRNKFAFGDPLPKLTTEDQWASVAYAIGGSLECVSKFCPDREVRAFAIRHLEDPLWRFLWLPRDINGTDFAAHRAYREGRR